MDTTIAKTTQAAELLAASILINELCKKADTVGNTPINPATEFNVLLEYSDMLDALATIVTSTFSPAEA